MISQNALMARINLDIHKALKTGGTVGMATRQGAPVLVIRSEWAWRGWHSEVTYGPASGGVYRQEMTYDNGEAESGEGCAIASAWPFSARG